MYICSSMVVLIHTAPSHFMENKAHCHFDPPTQNTIYSISSQLSQWYIVTVKMILLYILSTWWIFKISYNGLSVKFIRYAVSDLFDMQCTQSNLFNVQLNVFLHARSLMHTITWCCLAEISTVGELAGYSHFPLHWLSLKWPLGNLCV